MCVLSDDLTEQLFRSTVTARYHAGASSREEHVHVVERPMFENSTSLPHPSSHIASVLLSAWAMFL